MDIITRTEDLEAHYGTPGEAARIKVARWMTPAYRAWIARSRLCILSTVGPEGTDASPRGDDGPVVREIDPATLALPMTGNGPSAPPDPCGRTGPRPSLLPKIGGELEPDPARLFDLGRFGQRTQHHR